MKDLERENVRLKRLVADLSLEKQVLKDVASGNLYAPNGAVRRLKASGRSMASPNAMPAGLSASTAGHSDTPPSVDIKQSCATVKPGGSRIEACLQAHLAGLSNGCKAAISGTHRT
jgi:hypothetical protein